LNFDGGQAVPRNVDDVVNATQDPDVAVFIRFRSVAGKEPAAAVFGPVVALPVGVVEAFRVAPDGAGSAGTGTGDDDDALFVGGRGVARSIYNSDVDAGEWAGAGTGFKTGVGLARGDDGGTGFGLPPSVHHGYALGGVAADVFSRPLPGFWVDCFAYGSAQA